MNRSLAIDPNNPTQEEIEAHNYKVSAHNHKVAKANLASKLAEALCNNVNVAEVSSKTISNYAIAISEDIIETYSLLPDAAGNKGGLVS